MGRIRTIKPELFLHSDLYDLEVESGLPIRLSWIGLFTCCDREGRFKWRPRELKLQILPYDECDFSRVLDALASRGFVVKYVVDDAPYGVIPKWSDHQVINNRESASVLPDHQKNKQLTQKNGTAVPRVNDASATRETRDEHAASGEGKGREGKGKEGKGKEQVPRARGETQSVLDAKPEPPTAEKPEAIPAEPLEQDLSLCGERLEQSQEQFTEQGQEGEKKITPECEISCNQLASTDSDSTEPDETAALPSGAPEDESGDAGVPANAHRGQDEAATQPKAASKEPSKVSLGGLDKMLDIEELIAAHPKPDHGYHVRTAAIDEIARLVQARGMTETEAYTYLLGRFQAYKQATDAWPEREHRWIKGVLNFLLGRVYEHKESTWRNDDGDEGTGTREALLRKLKQVGGDIPVGGGIVLVPRTEEFRQRQRIVRDAARGPRSGSVGDRTFRGAAHS